MNGFLHPVTEWPQNSKNFWSNTYYLQVLIGVNWHGGEGGQHPGGSGDGLIQFCGADRCGICGRGCSRIGGDYANPVADGKGSCNGDKDANSPADRNDNCDPNYGRQAIINTNGKRNGDRDTNGSADSDGNCDPNRDGQSTSTITQTIFVPPGEPVALTLSSESLFVTPGQVLTLFWEIENWEALCWTLSNCTLTLVSAKGERSRQS